MGWSLPWFIPRPRVHMNLNHLGPSLIVVFLLILGDIEVAARMLEEEGKMGADPLTEQYLQLKNEIKPVVIQEDDGKDIAELVDFIEVGLPIASTTAR